MANSKSKASKNNSKKKTTAVKENNRSLWLIVSLFMAILLFFTISRMGLFGIISNNILTYLFGSVYPVALLSLFAYAFYVLFFWEKYPISTKTLAGIIVANIFIILLNACLIEEVSTFKEYGEYADTWFRKLPGKEVFPAMGGLLGNLLYVSFTSLLTRTGTLIITIFSLVIAAILLIPLEAYKETYSFISERIQKRKAEAAKHKEEQRQKKLAEEEERRIRLAEEIARLDEQEQLKKTQLEQIDEEEEEEEIVVEKKVNHDYVLSNSPTFINLNEKEIYGDQRSRKQSEAKPLQIMDEKPEKKVLKPQKRFSRYRLPKPYEDYLDAPVSKSSSINKTSAGVKGERVIEILKNFNIDATLLNTYIGPSVTKFEIKPDSSVKVNKIINISDNIKMELAAKDIRIEAPIPGRSAVGIEIPNVEPVPVRMLDLIRSIPADKRKSPLLFCLGKDLMGKPVYCELNRMPHLLIAGATGSGKSVCINAIITSFLLRTNPDDVKLVLVDPKKVEFTPYKDIPHLLWPIIDDSQMAANMLKKVVVIMEERYDVFATAGVRNIDAYNELVSEHNASLPAGEEPMNKLPYMVVIIDELADLMAIAGKDVELSIQRITQLARASGIHLIVATQRPSTDVITGLIKSNIPSRISFAVASSIDSRTILDQTGAERLLGNGDMLYYPQGETAPIRLQGVYVTDKEISRITAYCKSQAQPEYEDSYFEFLTNATGTSVMSGNGAHADSLDSLYDEVVEFVKAEQRASTSLLQRRFGIGYNRAARLIDTLEDRGIIGPANGSKPREVYLKPDEE